MKLIPGPLGTCSATSTPASLASVWAKNLPTNKRFHVQLQESCASVHVNIWPTHKTNSGLTIRKFSKMNTKTIITTIPVALAWALTPANRLHSPTLPGHSATRCDGPPGQQLRPLPAPALMHIQMTCSGPCL